MAQLRAKQIKLAAAGDLLIGGDSGNGSVLTVGTAGQVLKVLTGGALGYEAAKASETTYDNTTSGLTATDVKSAIDELKTLAGTGTSGIQTEVDAIESAVGLGTDGTKTDFASANYVAADGTFKAAIEALDTQLKTTDTATGTNATAISDETTRAEAAETAIHTGAGLGTDGTYTADGSANYISGATSLKNADSLLDAQIKANADAIASLSGGGGGSLDTLQTEVDAIETAVGLGTDGTLAAFQTGGYVDGKTTYLAAVNALDSQVQTNTSAIAGLTGLGALRFDGTVDGNETSTDPYDAETNTGGLQVTPVTGSVYRVATTANSNWAGTSLEVNVGDYVVKTSDGWLKFDNTDPTVAAAGGETAITVTGGTHEGYTLALDQTKITFAAAAGDDGKFLKWDNTSGELVYADVTIPNVPTRYEEDFTPTAAANVSFNLTYTPAGSIAVYMNGVKLPTNGYALAGKAVTLNDTNNGYPYETGDTLSVSYDTADTIAV